MPLRFINVLFLASPRGIALRDVRYGTLSLMARGKYLRLPRARSRRNRRVCGVIEIEPRKLSRKC